MWDLKYRPQVFSDVLGQEGATQVLSARLREGKAFETSYIFAGGHGCGKTSLSRILARAMLCQSRLPDGNPCNACEHCKGCFAETLAAFRETDAASQGTTADMRQLVEDLAFPIPGVPKRIYLLDEAHRMSKDAQDVLLKPIEDKRVVIIFCTTELAKIRGTIGSRCEVHEIRKIDREDILRRMKSVLETEKVEYEDDAVLTVIDLSKGHVRDIFKKLETVAQLGPITVAAVRDLLNLSVVTTYYNVLLSLQDPAKALALVEEACDRVGPADVAAGLAEAAMNAYRYSNKMHADFTHFDRDLATQVAGIFGTTLPSVARYFLRETYPSRLSLVCDVVALCESGGAVHERAPVSLVVPVASHVVTAPVSSTSPSVPTLTPPATPTTLKIAPSVQPQNTLTTPVRRAVSATFPRDNKAKRGTLPSVPQEVLSPLEIKQVIDSARGV